MTIVNTIAQAVIEKLDGRNVAQTAKAKDGHGYLACVEVDENVFKWIRLDTPVVVRTTMKTDTWILAGDLETLLVLEPESITPEVKENGIVISPKEIIYAEPIIVDPQVYENEVKVPHPKTGKMVNQVRPVYLSDFPDRLKKTTKLIAEKSIGDIEYVLCTSNGNYWWARRNKPIEVKLSIKTAKY
jgi:hypothetical protein